MSSAVEVRAASPHKQTLVAGLMQFYLHDFSTIGNSASPLYVVDPETGAFPPYPGLERYWADPGHLPFVIRTAGEVAGFALVDRTSRDGREIDWAMSEFFVLRKFRRSGVGGEAVRQILGMQPGRWEVAVMENNVAAWEFWPGPIAGAPNVTGFEARAGDGTTWSGPIWSFRAV